MSIFKNLFNTKKDPTKIFPKESNEGNVKIENNQIICTDSNGIHSCIVHLKDLQYAYITIRNNKLAYLFLFDYHQNFIPVTYTGFSKVYKELSTKFNFKDTIFFENVAKKTVLKKEIWRKHYVHTFEILTTKNNDYNLGFEIQSPPKQFISWDTTYEELEKNKNTLFEKSPYGQKLLKFNAPVRIGNILLKDFGAYFDNDRADVPVLHYYTHCFNNIATDESYLELKKILNKDLASSRMNTGYERADQKNINFNLKEMHLSICYTYDSDWLFNGGYTSLSIENKREYPSLLHNESYEELMVISDFLLFKGNIKMSGDYRKNKNIKNRPEKINLQFKDNTIIWVDNKNKKIGFSSNHIAELFDIDEINSFCIQNILPAKGNGGAYLEIITDTKKYNYPIFYEACNFFDTYALKIEKITGKKVVFGKEYYDC
ncbi:hypothetical protein [Polaribacter sp. HaHaR_3_91]|uniref:hypothetical protein n=1 Tax=Polaribacter sp. HaHaR_3_91 TaxID=2745561 RepID=UPI001C4F131B|nr:hypothetical protein [Polaribacter sp. HaHaR_3_91]QXP62558.1 hypothetical protein H0I27_11795 [Polaribacter sp. HaHaR_3_91]